MTPSDVNTLIGMVDQFREDMGRRFDGIDERLDGVCKDVSALDKARAYDAGVAAAAAVAATSVARVNADHVLSTRWRATFAVAAGGGLVAGAAQLVPFLRWVIAGL